MHPTLSRPWGALAAHALEPSCFPSVYATRRGRVTVGRGLHRTVRGGGRSRDSWDVGFLPLQMAICLPWKSRVSVS